MKAATLTKLRILAESARYDASCASSGSSRQNRPAGLGNALPGGVCHSFTEDGRCISLLKVLYSNACVYDCAYCVNRRANDGPRTAFTPGELAELTIEFYRRNYIEGLFLSSAVLRNPDYTMERLVRVIKDLRIRHRFNGYIHMKAIPGADRELVMEAGRYADRLSVNIEIPREPDLKRLAPDKDYDSVRAPMRQIQEGMLENREERRRFASAPRFVPAGQSTQMIVGAGQDRDRDILRLSADLYARHDLQRVYYSGFVPVNAYDPRLPALKSVPLLREHRIYQADWLLRCYSFAVEELLDPAQPDLDLDIDPKLAWALRHPQFFPLDPHRAEYRNLLRVPGIGALSARRILSARRSRRLRAEHLSALGVVMKRACFFLDLPEDSPAARRRTIQEAGPATVRRLLSDSPTRGREYQLPLPLAPGPASQRLPATP